ncbi:MAG: helix-turn-helix domain-containing protein, partial [Acidimicrobiia bacterium]
MTERAPEEPDWRALSASAGFASHRLIGWIYWDPEAIANYAALGVPDGFGYYIASRGASLAAAGDDAVVAAFYSIHAGAIAACLDECRKHTTFTATALARDAAVSTGLRRYVPEI